MHPSELERRLSSQGYVASRATSILPRTWHAALSNVLSKIYRISSEELLSDNNKFFEDGGIVAGVGCWSSQGQPRLRRLSRVDAPWRTASRNRWHNRLTDLESPSHFEVKMRTLHAP
jgi:hypothetical protein